MEWIGRRIKGWSNGLLVSGLLIGIAAWGGHQPLAGQAAGQTYWTESQDSAAADGRCIGFSPPVGGRTVTGRRTFDAVCAERPVLGPEIQMPKDSAFATRESSGRLLPPWVLPVLGAGAGGSWLAYDTIRSCRDSDCVGGHALVPYAFVVGAAAGAAVGWAIDWVVHAL